MRKEIWKPLPGWEGKYEISSRARVRSFMRSAKPKILKPGLSSPGYFTVSLGRLNSRTLHSLMAEVFIGPKPEGMEVRHLNGVRTDNRIENLAYGTRTQNILDAIQNGGWYSKKRIRWLKSGNARRKSYRA